LWIASGGEADRAANFGVFEVKRRKARKARNPRTGEKVDVEPKNVVVFKRARMKSASAAGDGSRPGGAGVGENGMGDDDSNGRLKTPGRKI